MDSAAPVDGPRQFISALENKFSQLTVSPEDASLLSSNAEPLPAYTPSETPTLSVMPKVQTQPAESRGRSPGPRSLGARGLLRHRTTSRTKPKPKSGQEPQTTALVLQLKRRLRRQQRGIGANSGADSDEMEMDVDERGRDRRGRTSRRNSVRAGVLVARKRREGADDCADVGPSRSAATPYERNNSALVCWSRRRASSFGDRPSWADPSETTPPASNTPEPSALPPPANRRKRSGRSASTSGLPLPLLDTTDLAVRRPSFAMSLMMTPLVPDIDMASPMVLTPVMRTSTESSMWAPRRLNIGVTHGPIDETDVDTDILTPATTIEAKSKHTTLPTSPPPPYSRVIRQADDSDGDADDEQTPLRTTPLITVRDASPPAPGSGTASSGASKGSNSLATVTEEEEDADNGGEPTEGDVNKVQAERDQDAMVL